MPVIFAVVIVIACVSAVVVAATSRRDASATAAGQRAALESPIDGVSDAAWTEFVARWRGQRRQRTVTDDGRLGAFAFTSRELSDVGFMSEPRKGTRGVWLGTWAPGLDLSGFLGDARQQYHALVDLTKQHVAVISDNYAACIGFMIDGHPVSLSGLLAGARKAGISGLRYWVEDEADRRRHAETTDLIRRFSGIF